MLIRLAGEARNAAIAAATGALQDILDKTVPSPHTQHASKLVYVAAGREYRHREYGEMFKFVTTRGYTEEPALTYSSFSRTVVFI